MLNSIKAKFLNKLRDDNSDTNLDSMLDMLPLELRQKLEQELTYADSEWNQHPLKKKTKQAIKQFIEEL
jgi:hypothetical protein